MMRDEAASERSPGGHRGRARARRPAELAFRFAGPGDARAVAELHAASWRRHYRGAYSDSFLDGDVLADRLSVWSRRLSEHDGRRCAILAESNRLVGFANTVLAQDPRWGALLDNLHVADGHRRRGIGARLLSLSAQAVAAREPASGLYLWVLEQNVAAQAFYAACGGTCVGREAVTPPGGVAARLAGSPAKLRYAWPDAAALLAAAGHGARFAEL